MTQEQKIALLMRIATGQAGPEMLRPRRMVMRIHDRNSGHKNGLYVNGKLSQDPADWEEFSQAVADGKVKVVRK